MEKEEDEDVSKELLRLYKKRGIDVNLSVKDTKIAVFKAMPDADPAHYVRGQYAGYHDCKL